jgi:adenosylcobinamide hydrolase
MKNLTRQFDLASNIRLIIEDNVLAVLSKDDLKVVSSAAYHGGFRKVKAILNVEVPEGYSTPNLHADPMPLISASSAKVGVKDDFVCMITAVKVSNFSLALMKNEEFSVSVAATAGCTNAETAGENLSDKMIPGTINIIVVVDGNPTESNQVSLVITATEAKTAALNRLDIRSAYSGDLATGTTTDAVVVASTNRGSVIEYGGPSSKLGQMVSKCVRTVVTEAVLKQDKKLPFRSVLSRLDERGLSMERMASELSKIKSLKASKETLLSTLSQLLKSDPISSLMLLESAKVSWDFEKGLIPQEFGQIEPLAARLESISMALQSGPVPKGENELIPKAELDLVDLPNPLKSVLIGLVRGAIGSKRSEDNK